MRICQWKGINPTSSQAWQRLLQLKEQAEQTSINQRFTQNPLRATQLCLENSGLTVDLSRNILTEEIIDALVSLADDCDLKAAIEGLITGKNINNTENRAAHHTRLRAADPADTEVNLVLDHIDQLVEQIHSGTWRGFSGERITDIVNIGIGGSDLGPRLVTEALTPYQTAAVNLHFVSNMDPSDLQHCLRPLQPATTLFIVASKTFTTMETLTNASAAREWLAQSAGADTSLEQHFIAITAKPDRAIEFGMTANHILPMWDWVGGRYSLWSAIGLPIALAVGSARFRELLAGAASMDQHFASSDLKANIPVLMGLLDVWYVNFWQAASIAILPYHHNLGKLPAYLQQLAMESNGKQVDRDGKRISYHTCPVFWGSAGTVGQHSFHQLLHQGTFFIPIDFILPLQSHTPVGDQQAQLVANCLSQSIALSEGKRYPDDAHTDGAAPYKDVPGNRPSSLITMDILTPYTLGALLALYEHRVFTASVIWNINAFDQWGVELGKQIGTRLATTLDGGAALDGYDSGIQNTIKRYQSLQAR